MMIVSVRFCTPIKEGTNVSVRVRVEVGVLNRLG
jgi:hypothetical protein